MKIVVCICGFCIKYCLKVSVFIDVYKSTKECCCSVLGDYVLCS